LRNYREEDRRVWGGVSEDAAARYVAGVSSAEERERVEQAIRDHPPLRELLAIAAEALVPGDESVLTQTGRLTMRDAARMKRVPLDTVQVAVSSGELDAVALGDEIVWISRRSLDNWQPKPLSRPVDNLTHALAASTGTEPTAGDHPGQSVAVTVISHGVVSAAILLRDPELDRSGKTVSVVGAKATIPGRRVGDSILVRLKNGRLLTATVTHIHAIHDRYRASVVNGSLDTEAETIDQFGRIAPGVAVIADPLQARVQRNAKEVN
jgi:hypothetical protein